MAEYRLPFGRLSLPACLPDDLPVDVIAAQYFPAVSNPQRSVEAALQSPVGEVRLENFADSPSVAIAINDKTRPVPHGDLLPPLLAHLTTMGIPPQAVTLIIATGTHPPMQPDEFAKVLPANLLARYTVICHDCDDQANLVDLGVTARGTPVWVNRLYAQAGLRIVLGNIEPHQFQGFSGGVKTAAIGLAGRLTINHNHAMMREPLSRLGEYDQNPARQDVEEIGRRIGVHFALNAVLNEDKAIVHTLAGGPEAVMRAGIPLVRQVCQVAVPSLYDLMIVSPGGHPKDINLYQAQKGLAHACLVTRPGGTVILAAACPEGSGSRSYEAWMQGVHSYAEIFARFKQEGFQVGPHKAFQIARDASRVRLRTYTEMPEDFARFLLLNPISDLQVAVEQALVDLLPGGRVGLMPHATSTIPYLAT
jgi:nickel-dependent lactate racemase